MAEARRRDSWSRTSNLMALLANCHRDPSEHDAFLPDDFDPFAPEPEPVPGAIGVQLLNDMFPRGRKRK